MVDEVARPARRPDSTLMAFTCTQMAVACDEGVLSLAMTRNARASYAVGVLAAMLGLPADRELLAGFAAAPGVWAWAMLVVEYHEVGMLDRATGTGWWNDDAPGGSDG